MARILVIDDLLAVGRAIARMLRGYETSTEADPRRAVRRIAEGEHFDLVLCDLDMPHLSGRDVADAIRREPADRRPLVLMMSGHDNIDALFETGCPVLTKPFTGPELRELVSALLHDGLHAPIATGHAAV